MPATTANIGPIESFASAEHLEAKSLSVPQWTDVAGRIELAVGAGQTKLPLIVRSPLAFGQVIFVGLDLHQPPFANWPSRGKFLEKLLGRNGAAGQQAHNEHGLKGATHAQRLGVALVAGLFALAILATPVHAQIQMAPGLNVQMFEPLFTSSALTDPPPPCAVTPRTYTLEFVPTTEW